MKFLSVAAVLLAPLSVSAASFPSFFDPSQAPIKVQPTEDFPVKGDNPLQFCDNPSAHLLKIDSVDLSPNPLYQAYLTDVILPSNSGQTLNIKASGTLLKTIEDGAKVNLVVKWGLITLIQQTADLCEQIANVDLQCPLEKGELVLEKQVDLPKQIPPGKYSVFADVYTKDKEQVTCLKADNIQFNIPR